MKASSLWDQPVDYNEQKEDILDIRLNFPDDLLILKLVNIVRMFRE